MKVMNEPIVPEGMRAIPDPGFCEADIQISMKDTAQSHINWIYESILARMEPSAALRLRPLERQAVRNKAVDLYKAYLGDVLTTL